MSNMKLKSEKYFCTAVCKFDEADMMKQDKMDSLWSGRFGTELEFSLWKKNCGNLLESTRTKNVLFLITCQKSNLGLKAKSMESHQT